MARHVVAAVLVALAVISVPAAQEERRVGLDEQKVLEGLVEDAVVGKATGGNAWLKWTPHFFRGAEGKTYVAFTLRIDEAPGGFKNAAMYVRIAPRGDPGRAARRAGGIDNPIGIANGELPVNSPERRPGVGAPTASDASLMLRSLTAKRPEAYPYESMYGVTSVADGPTGLIRRSFAVAPGDYDLYIGLLEQGARGPRRSAVLKQQISVPPMSGTGLRLSSVVLADRIDALAAPLNAREQVTRPYALGSAELIPATDDQLAQQDTLHLAFVIYDAAVDAGGKPDVTIEYRLYRREGRAERLLGSTPPQALDSSTLPPGFDPRAGHQLAASQSLPLSSYASGPYRIVVRVLDNRSGATAEDEIRFVIAD